MRILIVGNPEKHHVGAHFLAAGQSVGWECEIVDARRAKSRNIWVNRFYDKLMRRRPAHLAAFNKSVVSAVARAAPDLVLTTGVSAVTAESLRCIREKGSRTINFLTDDPWNPRNGAGFFWDALREYDIVASPRMANLQDLRNHGCRRVEYLPFGYNPDLHFVEHDATPEEEARYRCEVAILGGADEDRVPLARALSQAGIDLALYGGYWDRYPDLKPHWRGFVHDRALRLAVRLAKCQICMGRKANRDGHAMRSIEFPAMGACLLTEDTPEHRELFGPDGVATLYWASPEDMVDRVREIVADKDGRDRMATKLHRRMTEQQQHSYHARLVKLVGFLDSRTKNEDIPKA
ncbi:MAG: glycosyltransferase [Verrucomicrobiales bacterium]